MADSKKYNGSTWEHSLRKLGTATETLTLPQTIYADGTNASLSIKGNTTQSGTPSPSNPVSVDGCGDMSSNILSVYKENYSISATGVETYNTVAMIYKAEVAVADSTFVLNFGGLLSGDVVRIHAYTGDTWQQQIAAITITQVPFTFTLASNIDNIRVSIRKTATDVTMTDGQYKIPISSANTATPVYLGEVETTRKIKKLLLTGEENWNYSATSQAHWIANVPNDYDNTLSSQITTVCTHYKCIRNDTGIAGMVNNDLRLYAKSTSPVAHELYIKDETYTSAADFKAYLAAQYAAGTPVTVWYVLATPTTGIVNEPLRKIGTYADTVSGITIPTITGKDTFDVLTTLKPSEVELTYTGWHDAEVKEWDGSDWQ